MLRKSIQRPFQRDVPVQVVTPVPVDAFQPLPLDRSLNAADEFQLQFRFCCQRLGKVDAAGQMQRGTLPCILDLRRFSRSE